MRCKFLLTPSFYLLALHNLHEMENSIKSLIVFSRKSSFVLKLCVQVTLNITRDNLLRQAKIDKEEKSRYTINTKMKKSSSHRLGTIVMNFSSKLLNYSLLSTFDFCTWHATMYTAFYICLWILNNFCDRTLVPIW